jgi:hypothetical protein
MRQIVHHAGRLTSILLLLPFGLLSQDAGTGTLTGVVMDPAGAAVPGANVSVTAIATHLVRSSSTDVVGNYTFANLPIGRYDVTVANSGFATITNTNVTVSVGTSTHLDVRLSISAANQEISVQAQTDQLNVSNAETGGLFNSAQVTDLPLAGRNFLNLVSVETGIRSDSVSGRQSFVINGAPPQQGFNFMVDGTDATGVETGEVGGGWTSPYQSTYALSLDSIAEFVVHSSSYSAKYGRALGGMVEAVTKSGTNDVHGNMFYYVRNNIFNANATQANAAGLSRPELRFNQYGANTGGAIVRNKLFYWLGFEGVNRRTGVTNNYTVLSPLGRSSIQNPVIQSFVNSYLPTANEPATSNPYLALLVRNDVSSVREDMGTARIDYNWARGDNLFVRYNIHDADAATPILGGVNTFPGRQQLATTSWTHIFSPSMTANVRVGVDRAITTTAKNAPNPGIVLTGIFTVAGSYLRDFPQSETLAADLTKVKGAHTLQMGIEIRKTVDGRIQDNGSSFNYFGGANQMNNFFNNQPDQLAQTDNIGGNAGFTGNYSPYFQDDYKVSRKLTLNLGLRWDYYIRPSERFGRVVGVEGSIFPLSQLHFKQPGQPLFDRDLTNFGPRFGFAYQVDDKSKTVIRGGAGIFVGNNYPGLLTIAASTYIPPMIPASLYSFGYTRSITYFTPGTVPNLSFPNTSFISVNQLLQTLALPNSGPAPTLVAPDWRDTAAYQWNFSVERAITTNSSLSADYVGTRSVHVIGQDAFNPIRPLAGNTREDRALGTLSVRGTFNNAFYNALQTKYTRRLSNGLQFEANYTWSHSIDDLFGYGGQDNPGVTPQTNSRQMQRGSSGYDKRHDFHAYYHYTLPLGSSRLARGWDVGGITRISSGVPYTVLTGTNIGDGSHVQRPNLLCTDASTGASTALFAQILNRSCFAAPTVVDPTTGFKVGNLGRNTFTGPSLINFDFTVTKDTKISERFTHQFRVDFFNIFNNTNYNPPNTSLNDPNFGRITGAAPGRELQFAMKLLW